MAVPQQPERPDIDYPVRWTYKIIGEDEQGLRAAVAEVVGDRDHAVAFSHNSTTGRYLSLTLEVVVSDEDERNGLFAALGAHEDVKVIL